MIRSSVKFKHLNMTFSEFHYAMLYHYPNVSPLYSVLPEKALPILGGTYNPPIVAFESYEEGAPPRLLESHLTMLSAEFVVRGSMKLPASTLYLNGYEGRTFSRLPKSVQNHIGRVKIKVTVFSKENNYTKLEAIREQYYKTYPPAQY